jgi:hypothetical protein
LKTNLKFVFVFSLLLYKHKTAFLTFLPTRDVGHPANMRSFLAILSLVGLSVSQTIETYSGKDDGLSQHTIYKPNTKEKVPVLVFSSGGCFREGIYKPTACLIDGTDSFHRR